MVEGVYSTVRIDFLPKAGFVSSLNGSPLYAERLIKTLRSDPLKIKIPCKNLGR
jgi:hypothetical protein